MNFCYQIEITGIIQGIGFRPFIYKLAKQFHLNGIVFNHEKGVTIEIESSESLLREFVQRIQIDVPSVGRIDSIDYRLIPNKNYTNFQIIQSKNQSNEKFQIIPKDISICIDCKNELLDRDDKRYFYPFINCTNCGPRFTIIRDVPYDRRYTSMDEFPMCKECNQEYNDPENRRFHAQPNACPICGPQIQLLDKNQNNLISINPIHQKIDIDDENQFTKITSNRISSKTILEKTTELLRNGSIFAIKGLGGFHIVCDATSEEVVYRLRERKRRNSKPLAVMFSDILSIREYAHTNLAEETLLLSNSSPIVILRKKKKSKQLANSVTLDNHFIGAFLPYTGLHELLLASFGQPLVMTSANISDEPIVYDNKIAYTELSSIVDYFLTHNREIYTRCDDSVLRVYNSKTYFYRRSRGYSPESIRVESKFLEPILSVGSYLKNTFSLAKDNEIIMSHHIGDLDNPKVMQSFEDSIQHYQKLFHINPKYIAYDMHPEYLNTKWVWDKYGQNPEFKDSLIAVQHHHAHIVSCMTDNQTSGVVIGLAMDGTGYGTDGSMWGGEFLIADDVDFIRVGHIDNLLLVGGDTATRQTYKIGLAILIESGVGLDTIRKLPFLSNITDAHFDLFQKAVKKRLNTFTTTSMGRLFDAFSAIADVVTKTNYEGQGAIEFEQLLYNVDNPICDQFYTFIIEDHTIRYNQAVHELVHDIQNNVDKVTISYKFHNGIVQALKNLTLQISNRTHIKTIALSGGCFLNLYLLDTLKLELEKSHLNVIIHQKVPTGDGGISLGQAIIAKNKTEGKKSCVWQYQ